MTIVLNFENIKNIRDLGQTSTKDRTVIKKNHLLRAANPCFASKQDCAQLQNMNIDVVVDFRDKHEKKKTEKPFQKLFQNDALPITAGNLTPANLIPTLQRSSSEEMRGYMKDLYASFPIEFQEQYRSFLRHAEQGKKVLYHCTAGKDRTGFGSALLLSALDVDYEIIMDDFLASNIYFAEVGNQITQQLAEQDIAPDVVKPLMTVEKDYLDAAFATINSEFGSVKEFLTDTLQINCQTIQEHYLEQT